MRFNPKARLDNSRVSDSGSGGGFGGGGGGMRMPIPGGNMAGGGIGGLIIVVLLLVLGMCSGIDLTGGSGPATGSGGQIDTSRVAQGDTGRYAACKTGEDANKSEDCARIAVENSLYDFWSATMKQYGKQFTPATMQTFSGATQTGCGQASSQVGPFYCPVDQFIYLDTTFFQQVLQGALDGPSGAFVEPYVIAHEYGHHIQNLLGTMNRVKTQQGPRSDAVRLELQADCYAGVWTSAATRTQDAGGVALFEELSDADIKNAIDAASAVGDDRIQQKTQGQVTQESWTHGSSASRVKWFQTGYQSGGDLNACDTWAVDTP
jgi:predicted metalloprotease